MTFDYADTAALAVEALTEFGAPITRRSTAGSVYSPGTGSAASVRTDSVRLGAIFDYGPGTVQVRGSLIQVSDKRLLVDPSGDLLPTDLFVVDGKTYSIVSVGTVKPAGTVVLYDLHVRG